MLTKPLGHAWHCGEPGPAVNVEMGQRTHNAGANTTVEFGTHGLAYVPAGHVLQTALVVAPAALLALPGAQGSHCIAAPLPFRKSPTDSGASVSQRPALHTKQVLAASPDICPIGQGAHEVASGPANVPGAHGRHATMLPDAVTVALLGVDGVTLPVTTRIRPLGHALQLRAPPADQYKLAHGVHAPAPDTTADPGAHATQALAAAAPAVSVAVPSLQGVHAEDPIAVLYEPVGQSEHGAPAAGEYQPGLHP